MAGTMGRYGLMKRLASKPPKSTAESKSDFRTGENWSRTVARKATVKGGPNRTVVKVKREVTNYEDNPMGGRIARSTTKGGYKKVYKNGVLKRTKTF